VDILEKGLPFPGLPDDNEIIVNGQIGELPDNVPLPRITISSLFWSASISRGLTDEKLSFSMPHHLGASRVFENTIFGVRMTVAISVHHAVPGSWPEVFQISEVVCPNISRTLPELHFLRKTLNLRHGSTGTSHFSIRTGKITVKQ